MRALGLCVLLAACSSPAAFAPAPRCPAIGGLAAVLPAGGLLVLGEIHGSEEIPRFVGDVVCAAAGPVTLGLEIPRGEQARIDAFVAGGASPALLAGEHWTRPAQDGRSSRAMLGLLERVRAWRAAGRDVRVLAFDVDGGSANRDRDMATAIRAARQAEPARTLVVLTGNYHSRRSGGAPWDPAARWMASYLGEDGLAFTTLDVDRRGGATWNCTSDEPASCHAYSSSMPRGAPAWRAERAADVLGHDGRYAVGPFTASPPATAGRE